MAEIDANRFLKLMSSNEPSIQEKFLWINRAALATLDRKLTSGKVMQAGEETRSYRSSLNQETDLILSTPSDRPVDPTILNFLVPFANKLVLLTEHSINGWEVSYSLVGMIRGLDADAINDVFDRNVAFRELVLSGHLIVLPRQSSYRFEGSAEYDGQKAIAPDWFVSDLVSDANLVVTRSAQYLSRDELQSAIILKSFLLPCWPDIHPKDLIAFCQDEGVAYKNFLRWVRKEVRLLPAEPSKDSVDFIVDKIEDEVAKLETLARKVSRHQSMSRVAMGGFMLSMLSASGVVPFGKELLGLGCVSGIQAYNQIQAARNERDNLIDSPFLLPFNLRKASPE